ncbi:aminoacyl-histidine dipeptidase [Eubacterium multiforme]|uniref:Dipeptidase D n=1 Tax=Eubacterium multiforme TaxID=83339 RepID=A0ABT9UXJ1_9FIRM|nr:aminoacyl-histidine dipeptidase [Eubacterium multiforme]MDQ0151032.1 dipeptidase D [Eubacterium multiforme]
MSVCENLEPKKVFEFFEELTKIPHGSYHEKEISDYLVDFAKKRNLEVTQDKALNVIIRKPATKGYENSTPVIIQGHMDMVCEKAADSDHDFEKEPLKLRIEGDNLYATKTTLGADDGIAVAYALAILDSNDIPHPALEVVVTTAEEVGMDGAMALDTKALNGKVLLNIDSEEEGVFLVGCAGGIETKATFSNDLEEKTGTCMQLKVSGLLGGHSGIEIIKQRANANKLMGRLLFEIGKSVDFNLVEINGGTKHNAIPRECIASITVKNEEDIKKVKDIYKKMEDDFKVEYRVADPNLSISECNCCSENNKQFTAKKTSELVDFLVAAPNGVQNMSKDIEGLVQTSLNLAVIKTNENGIEMTISIRSSIKSLKYEVFNTLSVIAKRTNTKFEKISEYPEWQYDPDSKIRELCKKVYKDLFNKDAEISAIHAGLECGLFKETMKDTDMISFGPSIYDAHTENEHLCISSTERTYKLLLEVLKEMK